MTTNAPAADAVDAYLDETVRVWLGLREPDVEVPRLPEQLARLLLRLEEHERPERDRWGCWDYAMSENAAELRIAPVDRWLAEQREELARRTTLEPLWPAGHSFAICLTHDVDVVSDRLTPTQVLRSAQAAFAHDGGNALVRAARPPVRVARALRAGVARAPSLSQTLERSVELATAAGAVASYFFTVPPAGSWTRWDCTYAPGDRCTFRGEEQRIADVMCTLRDEGFDVGLHGSYESARAPGVLEAEKALLERVLGSEVTTTRQHFLHWDIRWTPGLQEHARFRADSSLGFNRSVGFRAGTSLPFHQFDLMTRRALDLLEVPLVVQDAALLGPIGLGRDEDATSSAVWELFEEVAAVGGLLTFVFHPDKLDRPDWLALYESVLDHAAASGAWLTSLARLDDWWRERERTIVG